MRGARVRINVDTAGRGNCAVIAADSTLKSTASFEKQLNNGEFYVTAIVRSVGSLYEGGLVAPASEASKISNWCESNTQEPDDEDLGSEAEESAP